MVFIIRLQNIVQSLSSSHFTKLISTGSKNMRPYVDGCGTKHFPFTPDLSFLHHHHILSWNISPTITTIFLRLPCQILQSFFLCLDIRIKDGIVNRYMEIHHGMAILLLKPFYKLLQLNYMLTYCHCITS